MLEPTDRVLAKIILRTWLLSERESGTSPIEFAEKFVFGTLPFIQGNRAMADGLVKLLSESVDEILAEEEGQAAPNHKPYPLKHPQPWHFDAGGEC